MTNPEWDAAYDAICDRVEARVGVDSDVRYSNYGSDANGVPRDNLDELAIPGSCVVVCARDEDWGGAESQDFQSEILENPTWLDLCVVLNDQMNATLNQNHVFLEGVQQSGSVVIDGKEVPAYKLLLGS